ncbi:MAG TPA: hypothetical protein DCY35_04640 [Prolixibacteraceae bacterium]|jgi:hypothetical protein|nr:hypothetical protein [Prolixibacteraceae bacterium]
MAITNIMELAEVTPVYYDEGKFPNGHKQALTRAPFDLVMIPSTTTGAYSLYVKPVSSRLDKEGSGGLLSTNGPEHKLGFESSLNYYTSARVIVGRHEMGDFTGQDNWKARNKFDY